MPSALEELANTPDPQPKQSGSALEALLNTPDPAEAGRTDNADGSFVITPKDGESFSDTMKRAAAAGKTVTPQMIQSQTQKGLKEAPTVLAATAAPAVGLAAGAELASATPAAVKAISEMAAKHPIAAQLVKKALITVGGATAYKHSKWLLDLLP